jgi:hypothetical protein
MDFDLFLEEMKKRTPKRKVKKTNPKKVKDKLESAILDDRCTEIPQTNDGRRAYK